MKKFITHLVRAPFVVEILELAGGWDYAVRFYYKNMAHLNKQISALEAKFGGLIDNCSIFFIDKNLPLPYNALFEKYAFESAKINQKAHKIDELDLRILAALSSDGRKSLAQLQLDLQENRMTIHNRIIAIRRAGIIHSFRPNLFTEKLGFHWYVVSLKLSARSGAKTKSVVDKLKSLLKVHFIMTGFGHADIIFYMQVKTVQELQSMLYVLREEFSGDIKAIDSANTIKDYKWDFFPKGLLEELD